MRWIKRKRKAAGAMELGYVQVPDGKIPECCGRPIYPDGMCCECTARWKPCPSLREWLKKRSL